ncbi:MAG: phosphoribosylglycinamide formyltransferase [Saprospiraceae bacterium]|nr:phosphoribosylglycinamide formyltransferase [Saprospiraceae bacterium]
MATKHIAIFASGSGSNALKFLEYFDDREDIKVSLIVTNKRRAGVLEHAKKYDVPTLRIDRPFFYDSQAILDVLKSEHIDLIVLAGFLWLIPPYLVDAYPNKIINIHPALLPKYGGKGMYGQHVHKAVKENNETESGMTIHFVNQKFDEGLHIFQAKCALDPEDSADDIARKVLVLEHKNYARVVDELLSK